MADYKTQRVQFSNLTTEGAILGQRSMGAFQWSTGKIYDEHRVQAKMI